MLADFGKSSLTVSILYLAISKQFFIELELFFPSKRKFKTLSSLYFLYFFSYVLFASKVSISGFKFKEWSIG